MNQQDVKRNLIINMLFLIGIIFYFTIQIYANLLWNIYGGDFAYNGYFVIFHFGMLFLGILFVIFPANKILKVLKLPFIVLFIYISSRLLVDEILEYKPCIWVLMIIVYLFIGLYFFNQLNYIFKYFKKMKSKVDEGINKGINKKRNSSIIVPLFLIFWILLSVLAYNGFNKTITITDPQEGESSVLHVSFYGYTFGSQDTAYYSTPLWNEEAKFYISLNSTFSIPMSVYFGDPEYYNETLEKLVIVFSAWEDKGIPFIFDINPYNYLINKSDYYIYYYIDYMDEVLDRIVNWVDFFGFSNFRGIEIDPEGSKWNIDENGNRAIINASQHARAAERLQSKFDEIATTHPTWEFSTIAVMNAHYDWFDEDRDNDIMMKSISAEPLDLDYYGWQTYMVQPEKYQSIDFYENVRLGLEHYGKKYVPWIGWFGGYDELSDRPEVYENIMTQIKICKYLEVSEVYIAPSRYFLGSPGNTYENHSQAINRLSELNTTLNTRFDPFELNYTQNRLIYTNFERWLDKINPHYFTLSGNILYDLYCNLDDGLIMWVEIGVVGIVILTFYIVGKKNIKKY